MKKTWDGIRELIGGKRGNRKSINAIRVNKSSPLVHEPSKVANIMNAHFATSGQRLAAKIPHSEKHFSNYLPTPNDPDSFVFHLVEPREISMEIILLPVNKSYGLYSCPVRLLKCVSHVLCVEHAILDIINKIQTNMDKKLYSCGVFIDLSKVFDTVHHNILLEKLHHYGIREVINKWFASYLKGRVQTTLVNNHISDK